MRRRTIAALTLGAGLVGAALLTATPASSVNDFSNPTPIVFPPPLAETNTASPYPSSIAVSGLTGVIADVNVTLKGLNHPYPDDIDLLLVGPGGQKSILMGDVGCASPVTNLDLTFDDDAPDPLPDSTPLPTTGAHSFRPGLGTATSTFCPSAFGGIFTTPAPAPAYNVGLAPFTGSDPNGTWSLYALDDTAGGTSNGSIDGGWELTFETAATVITVAATDPDAAEGSGNTGELTVTRYGDTTGVLPLNVNVTGTAGPGDYTLASPGFGGNNTTTAFTITPVDDTVAEGDESVVLTLTPRSGYAVGDPASATVTIDDDELVATTTGLASAPNPSNSGAPVLLTATVTPTVTGIGTPTGTVDFKNGTTVLCNDVPLTGLVATCPTSFTDSVTGLTAVYSGDSDYATSTSSGIEQTVTPGLSVTASDAAAGENGNPGEFTITRTNTSTDPLVVPITISGTATGGTDYSTIPSTVTIDGTHTSATVPVSVLDDSDDENDETVVLTIGEVPGFQVADPAATVVIAGNDHATTTALDTDANPLTSDLGTTPTFTATVTRDLPGAGAPQGTLTFTVDGADVPSCADLPLTDGTATCDLPGLLVGAHLLGASFTPTDPAVDAASTAGSLTHTVTPPMATITATDADAAEPADGGTFTVTLSHPAVGDVTVNLAPATGTATAPGDYAALPASVQIGNGESSATVTVTPADDATYEPAETVVLALAEGTGYTVGDPSSATVTITDDDPAPTTTVLTSNHNPSAYGQNVTLTATVTSPGGTPAGLVDVLDGPTVLCDDVALNAAGVATCDVNWLLPDAHPLTAVYAGNAHFTPSTSAPLAQTVRRAGAATAPSSGGGTVTTNSRTFRCHGVPATIVGTAGDDHLVGTNGRDVIVGRGGSDVIDGRGGDDLICAVNGDDLVQAGPGDDVVYGNAGDDELFGDGGRDVLNGGRGADVLHGGSGADDLTGGAGTDTAAGSVRGDFLTSIERRD